MFEVNNHHLHAHKTWGLVYVIKGCLFITDWNEVNGNFVQSIAHYLTGGSGYCFCYPFSDWHKVKILGGNKQAVSLHVYGGEFNLDEGIYVNDKNPDELRIEISKRSPFQDLGKLLPHIKV